MSKSETPALVPERCPDCGTFTLLELWGRLWCINPDFPEQPLRSGLSSQSEIVWRLRGDSHTLRPYHMGELIADIDRMTPDCLDSFALRQRLGQPSDTDISDVD